jgi:alpha-mannosidase
VDLSEKNYGVSLLNDCKYGYSVEGNTLTLTALKCADYPWPEADEGSHIFSYSLLPHAGDLYDAGVIQEAYAFNQPLNAVTVEKHEGILPDAFSLVSCDAPNVIVETVKKAEDDDNMIVRLYEAWNSKATATLTVPEGFTGAQLVNLMEEYVEDLPLCNNQVTVSLRNFEIATVKFIR